MNSYIQKGERIPFTAGANYEANDIVEMNDRAGVVCGDVDSGDEGQLLLEGVVELPKADLAMAFGEGVYGEETSNVVTTSSSGAKKLGLCIETSPTGTATVKVRLGAW